MFRTSLFLLLALIPGTAPAQSAANPPAALKPKGVTIAMRDGLRFDPPRFEAKPGQELIIRLNNADSTHQQHNFVIVRPGSRDAVTAAALTLGEKAIELAFVPPLPEVLASSPLLDPEKSAEVRWRLPVEPGIYPYVCTFPGHGAVMFGAIYSGVPVPDVKKDPNLPAYVSQSGLAGGGKRPFVQRVFLPDSGPASLAVALPGMQNFCWDAGSCRLRYAWEGAFIDAGSHWVGKGAERAAIPLKPWWTAGAEENPARLAWPQMPAGDPQFLGYRSTPAGPVFRYRIGSSEITETISALPGKTGLTLSVATAAGPRGQTTIQFRQP